MSLMSVLVVLIGVLLLTGCGQDREPLFGVWTDSSGKVTVEFVPPNSMIWVETVKRRYSKGGVWLDGEWEEGHYRLFRREGDDKLSLAWPGAGEKRRLVTLSMSLDDRAGELKLKGEDLVTVRNPWGQNEQADRDGMNDLTLKRAPAKLPEHLVGGWISGPRHAIVIGGSGYAVELGTQLVENSSTKVRYRDSFSRVRVEGDKLVLRGLLSPDRLGLERTWTYSLSGDTLGISKWSRDKERPCSRVKEALQLESDGEIDWKPFSRKEEQK